MIHSSGRKKGFKKSMYIESVTTFKYPKSVNLLLFVHSPCTMQRQSSLEGKPKFLGKLTVSKYPYAASITLGLA